MTGPDPYLRALATAPLDEKATTPEEVASVAAAREEYRRGEGPGAKEAKRALLK